MSKNTNSLNTSRNKQILIIALLLATLIMPAAGIIGVILMWLWMKWPTWIKALITLPFVIVILSYLSVLTYVGVAQPVQIKGETMTPNFMDGQYYMTNVTSEEEPINRGDVVIFTSPDSATELVKRVIALPNEKVLIEKGAVWVNDEPLDESAYLTGISTTTYDDAMIIEGEAYTVPNNNYFVLGDNRSRSSDSRVWGAVPANSIKSKVGFCYWNCWK